MSSRRRITVALVGLLVLVLGGWLVKDLGSGVDSGMQTKALSALPAEASQTWRLIQRGGPFPYPRNDGVVYENREKVLPQKQTGYYHEYTVPTPGSADRGPRRLITGGSQELYYTGDHYVSFVLVDPTK
ncbi:ribonuclease N [Amycolatopsis acidiphila]|uniref:Ribonuclease N n=1 Tax=Amycolatopsis acidiphila TaxID=715473 RepID=A0A558A614_9PSEU|nr:ribonuclease domain-containing protein [Amycolatopsis acidiphila]TVT19686.1 ribonuclease N [Amycolatopsis acidiphila]UIJ61795.1 ribonuclease N [Amycolatopsis acidiphila]GHG57902.1 ribonuclease N1 [Amycolatopsis acidiphila]